MADEAKNENEDEGAKPDEDKDTLGEAGKRALEAERKARRKAEADVKAARDELAQLKADGDASKSELEKLADKVGSLETRAVEAERKALIAEVAQAKNLPPALAKRLTGATRDELEADADELMEAVGGKNDAGATPEDENDEDATSPFGSRELPKESLKSGASEEEEQAPDPGKLADSILSSGW